MADEQVVAVALLTRYQLEQLGSNLRRYWLIDETPCFQGLLVAIDEAERELWRARDAQAGSSSEENPEVIRITHLT